jgi:competence protein ComGC
MSKPQKKLPVLKVITSGLACLFVGFLIVIVVPNFVRATHQTAANGCINNLRQLDSAKEQWKLETGKKNGDVPTEADLTPYIKLDSNGKLPKCPGGGLYTLNQIGEDPKCSIGTSAWPNNHILNDTNNTWWFNFKAAWHRIFGNLSQIV